MQITVRYDRMERPLYIGGFADVWKGKHGNRDVAVKVIRTSSTSDSEKILGVGSQLLSLITCQRTERALYRDSARRLLRGKLFGIRMFYRYSEP